MADLTFDDLIPQTPATQGGGVVTFEDLVPSFQQRLEKPVAPLIPSATPDQGNLWPVRHGAKGIEFDPYAGVLGSILRAITTGEDIRRGTIPTPYSGGAPQASPDVISRAGEMASLFSPVSPSYRAGVRYGVPPSPPGPPSAKAIKEAAQTGYKAMTRSGWEVPSSSVETIASQARRELAPDFAPPGVGGPGDAPRTYGRLEAMADPQYSATSIADLKSHYDSLTKTISRGGQDAAAAYPVRERVADMINNLEAHGARPQPGVTPTMTPAEVASTFDTARGNYRAALGSNRISGDLDPAVKGILETVEAKAQASGNYNIDQPLRNRALAILQDNANVTALHPDEKAALEAVVEGTIGRNALRDFGRIFGVSNQLGLLTAAGTGGSTGAGIGALIGGPAGAAIGGVAGGTILPVAGTTARAVARRGTKNALSAAEELMRSNSPLAQSLLQDFISRPPPIGRDAVMQQLYRGLLAPPPDRNQLPPGYI